MNQIARSKTWLPGRLASQLARKTAAAWADQRGVAAIEFGLFSILLFASLANVTDVSIYIYQRMQVETATQVAAQHALKTCGSGSTLPATKNCANLLSAIQTAIQSTSLGAAVTLQNGSPSEGYYCVNAGGALQFVSAVTSRPADCTAAGTPSLQPGDYLTIATTFTYQPIFAMLSVASAFPSPITRTAMMRLG
ncbi:MAG TPA: TadE/TadG family type IV pilus assembly protein [Bradyrhizobium sp.]|nr:TadE/TadG family type IV pilus assembly protein [Bradyrhizobium sp.]